jgi:hypothetical protein
LGKRRNYLGQWAPKEKENRRFAAKLQEVVFIKHDYFSPDSLLGREGGHGPGHAFPD